MQRGTANALRILGIIVTVLFTLMACGILLLLSICANADHSRSNAGLPFLAGAFFVLGGGIWLIVVLARRMMRPVTQPANAFPPGEVPPLPPQPSLTAPLTISREGQMAIDLVVFALCGSLLFSLISWFLNQRYFSSLPRSTMRPHLLVIQAIIFILYNAPYAIVIYGFLTKPARWTFYYATSVPAVLAIFTLFNMATLSSYYTRNPRGLLLAGVGWAVDIAILVFAVRAMHKNGVKADAPALSVAGVAAFFYFLIVRGGSTFLYSVLWR